MQMKVKTEVFCRLVFYVLLRFILPKRKLLKIHKKSNALNFANANRRLLPFQHALNTKINFYRQNIGV